MFEYLETNFTKKECAICEGYFQIKEKIIEENGKVYCEACYEERGEK